MRMDLKAIAVSLALFGALSMAGCAGTGSSNSGGSPSPKEPSEGLVPARAVGGGSHYENVIEMLRGRVPGLEIIEAGSDRIEVRIRGLNQSLQVNSEGSSVGQEPLVVLDGMPISRPAGEVLLSLNPEDVMSINVLKDVASTAVYGTRGANGVIIVRLRRDT